MEQYFVARAFGFNRVYFKGAPVFFVENANIGSVWANGLTRDGRSKLCPRHCECISLRRWLGTCPSGCRATLRRDRAAHGAGIPASTGRRNQH